MRVMRLHLDKDKNRISNKCWVKSERINDSNMRKIVECNLRDLYDDEVMLDCESDLKARIVRNRLEKDNISYKEYTSGSRGRHFHLLFKGMENLSDKLRIGYRALLIAKYNTDPAVKNGFIAMEYRPHFKTGRIKKPVKESKNLFGLKNDLDMDLLRKVKKKYSKKDKKTKKTIKNDDIEELRSKIKPTDLWSSWGLIQNCNRHDTPFAKSDSQRCVALKGDLWYDFHIRKGGDIFTAIQLKYDCGFKEAVERLRKGDY